MTKNETRTIVQARMVATADPAMALRMLSIVHRSTMSGKTQRDVLSICAELGLPVVMVNGCISA